MKHPLSDVRVGVSSPQSASRRLRLLGPPSKSILRRSGIKPSLDDRSYLLAIAATSTTIAAPVRPIDMLQAGFAALRDRARPVKIQPRAFRLVCRNGSLVSNFEGEDVELEPEEVEAAIARCFDLDRFAAIVAGLREAAEFGLPDPRPMLNEMGYMRGRVESERRIIAIEDAWDEEGDPTYYGLMNAITAVARDLPDFRERLELEAAGSIAWLESLPRARRGVARARMEVLESV